MVSTDVLWQPHPGAQTEYFRRGEFEVLFGGAAGPGKTDCLIIDAMDDIQEPTYHGILFRRTFPELQEIEDRAYGFYPHYGGVYKADKHRWVFPSGAKITLSHMQHERDMYSHQGKEYQFVGFDELTQFLQKQYLYLFSRARSKTERIRPRVRSTTNPGGIGHDWVKRRFRIGTIAPSTPIIEEYEVVDETGEIQTIKRSRVFIPARLTDNPTLLKNNPEYVINLMQLPETERRRLLDGEWDAFEGQAFPELNQDIHGFEFEPPKEWQWFGSFDWGASKPWSYGLWAVDYDGNLYRVDEIYGAKKDQDGTFLDEGTRETDEQIASMIRDIEQRHDVKVRYRTADPAIWSQRPKKDGPPGPSVQETMGRCGIYFVKGDNDRINGRRELHKRLSLDDDGKPGLLIHNRCRAWWQILPTLREDEKNPEDVSQKEVADHLYDETRYGIMSRPMKPRHTQRSNIGTFEWERKKYLAAKALADRRGIGLHDAYKVR